MSLTNQAPSLPETWAVKSLNSVAEFTRKPKRLYSPNEVVPFLPMRLIPAGRMYAEKCEYRSTKELGNATYVRTGDLLLAKITPCFENGKQAIVSLNSDHAFATTEVIPLRGRIGLADTRFLHFALLDSAIRVELASRMEGSTNRQRLPKQVVREVKIFLPPLMEQIKIVTVLSLIQRAIDQQEQLIDLTTGLKNALMHKLFSEGIRGEPQKLTEIGPVPQSWKIVELGESVSTIDYGLSKAIPKAPPSAGVKIVSTADLSKDGQILYNKIRKIAASDRVKTRLSLRDGDVLFNWRNSLELIGKTAVFEEKPDIHIFASFMLRIRCDEERSHNYYVKHLMNYFREKGTFVRLARRAVNQANYNKNEISVLKIPLPPYDEQIEIASIVNQAEERIAILTTRLTLLKDLFKSLLHQLMTAQIRVNDVDLSDLYEFLGFDDAEVASKKNAVVEATD